MNDNRENNQICPFFSIVSEPEPCSLTFQTVFAVIGNTDTEEGRGQSFLASLHLSYTDAMEAARGRGTFGADATVKSIDGVTIQSKTDMYAVELQNLHKIQRYSNADIERIRTAALEKLSPLEKEVLGLKS